MRVLPLLFILALLACSSRAGKDGPGAGSTRVEASCLPDRPECLRVLPGVGTYLATLTIETRATSVPPAPAGGEPDQWTPARMELLQKETVLLRRDASGNVQGARELADEDGFHFALVDTEFCLGFRYEPAVCRGADEGEVERRFQELAGTYREVLSWIDGRSRWEADGAGGFTLRAVDADPEPGDDWRKKSQIQEINGNFLTDAKTGEHRVRLDYSLSGVRPDGQRFTLRVQYEHRVSSSTEPIRMPEGALHQAGRHRHLLDRKALLGDHTPHSLRHLYKSRSDD